MGLETRTKTIAEVEYEVRQLDALKGRKVFIRLAKMLAPLLNAKGDGDMFARLGAALASVDEADFEYLCETFAPTTSMLTVDEQGRTRRPELSKVFAIHFAGQYDAMLEWLYFCLEVNFGSFIERLRSRADASPEQAKA